MKFFWKKEKDEPPSPQQEAEAEERKDMMDGVSELDTKTVKEVMVPRIDMQCIPVDLPVDQFVEEVRHSGFSRYPVYEHSLDNIVGVLYVKDIFRAGEGLSSFSVRKLMRKAYFIPESKHLDDLLREFKRRKIHIAIAVDEYGGVSGLVCMEDILEVIVGEIQDEFDNDEPDEVRQLGDGCWVVDARTPIEQINDEIGLGITDEENETLGGYVFELFGRIPAEGDHIQDGMATYTVMGVEGHKILSIKIQKRSEDVR